MKSYLAFTYSDYYQISSNFNKGIFGGNQIIEKAFSILPSAYIENDEIFSQG